MLYGVVLVWIDVEYHYTYHLAALSRFLYAVMRLTFQGSLRWLGEVKRFLGLEVRDDALLNDQVAA